MKEALGARETVGIYFDYASPFGYLASEVLPGFAERIGVSLDWRPIDQLRLSNYASGLPYSPVKRNYVGLDAIRSAEFHDVPLRIPEPFPVSSARAMRLAVVALGDARFSRLHSSLYRAAWRDGRDLSAPEVLSDCIEEAEGPARDWLARAELPETSERLASHIAEAEGAGVFGVPSLTLRGELFWGLDSLPVLEWRLEQLKVEA